MGRPTRPLISRERAAREALSIIDIHGLDALSLDLVANRLGVKSPSLYYHFKKKSELLAEVARLILMEVEAPSPDGDDWKDALVRLSVATRRSILQHANAAPLLLQFFPRYILLAGYDRWVAPCPLPPEKHLILIEGTEKLTFGVALFEAAHRARGMEPMPAFDRNKLPSVARAIRANILAEEDLFIATLRAFLDGLELSSANDTRKTTTVRKTAKKTAAKKSVAVKKAAPRTRR